MVLIILHHHFRAGGVRRVIELATPYLVKHRDGFFKEVVLASGEEPDPAWFAEFQARLQGTKVSVFVRPEFGYFSEISQSRSYLKRLRDAIGDLIRNYRRGKGLIWAHNLGLGRNLLLASKLSLYCPYAGIPLVFHHHDWWFENRWHHYASFRKSGFRGLNSVAQAVFPESWAIRFALINSTDAKLVGKHFGQRAAWIPNPAPRRKPPPKKRIAEARTWLTQTLSDAAPVWLMPCRLLRRKNIGEAILLARWLRPEAWLVTTGGISSAEEETYAKSLAAAASANGWRLRLGVLQGDHPSEPAVEELIAASEAVLLTSVQEGFGLTYLEATAARRPLIARRLPNIAPDLARFGFKFPYYYNEIVIDPALFDWEAEYSRQRQLYANWKKRIPRAASHLVHRPILLMNGSKPRPVPFSRLTLEAQLEVLTVPPSESWGKCAPLNTFLMRWRRLASQGQLEPAEWPAGASRFLSGKAFADVFAGWLNSPVQLGLKRTAGVDAQKDLLRAKLHWKNLYPILWQNLS